MIGDGVHLNPAIVLDMFETLGRDNVVEPSTFTPSPTRAVPSGTAEITPAASQGEGPLRSASTRDTKSLRRGNQRSSGTRRVQFEDKKNRKQSAKLAARLDEDKSIPMGRATMRHWPCEVVARDKLSE